MRIRSKNIATDRRFLLSWAYKYSNLYFAGRSFLYDRTFPALINFENKSYVSKTAK